MAAMRFKDLDINRSTAKLSGEIQARLDEWAKLKPSKYHTVEGMDAIGKSIGGHQGGDGVRDTCQGGWRTRSISLFASRLKRKLPSYGKVLSEGLPRRHRTALEETWSGPCPSAIKLRRLKRRLRKLQAVMRNDVTSAYGKRERSTLKQLVESQGQTNLDADCWRAKR